MYSTWHEAYHMAYTHTVKCLTCSKCSVMLTAAVIISVVIVRPHVPTSVKTIIDNVYSLS